ncbi:ATP-dependent Clp protease proteolytic subunit [Serratia aquatilis]|uniref:ATP-dependent Clp protease proteolytic subunit n=1 Tax=Serratia aquatilis TaxID=1737515 RepID=A0ABV6EKI8_9GAMM
MYKKIIITSMIYLAMTHSANADISKLISEDVSATTQAKVNFTADVTPKSASELSSVIDEINVNYPKLKRILLYINSGGGDMDSGRLAYWSVKNSHIPITTVDVSMTASAATLFYCAADQRYALPGSHFILHPASISIPSGDAKPNDVDIINRNINLGNEIFKGIYKKCTSLSDAEIKTILYSEQGSLSLNPQEAMKIKLTTNITKDIPLSNINYYVTSA